MLHIQRFIVNMIEENCYVLSDETGEAVIIDCGAFFPEEKESIRRYIEQNSLRPKRLLNTHGHFDHVFGAAFVHDTYGLLPEMLTAEAATYAAAAGQMRMFLHRDLPLATPPAGPAFNDGDLLTFGSHTLRAIATPGHTPGGVCFYCEDEGCLFSGDSLFRHAIGRTDLPGGSEAALVGSLRARVLTLPDDVRVFPGHGDETTIGEERRANFYLQ